MAETGNERNFINKMKRGTIIARGALIAFIVTAVLAAAGLGTGIGLLCRAPATAVIRSDDGAITAVARSYRDDGWYYGDSAGNLVKMSAGGEELYRISVAENQGVIKVHTDQALDALYVLDADYDFYRVTDNGKALEKEWIRNFAGGYNTMATDGEYLYFSADVSRRTQFLKYDIDDPAGDPVAIGQMYTCRKQGTAYEFDPVISGTIVGMYLTDDYLYVVTGEGQYHRIDKNFTLNNPFFTDEELAALGATRDASGKITMPEESYDSDCYLTARKQIAARASVFDRENERFYVASVDAKLVTFDLLFREDESRRTDLPNTPAQTGAMTFHQESGTFYIAYENISAVTAYDAADGTAKYQADTAFYISGMIAPAAGDRLLVICSGNNKDNPDYKELLSADVAALAVNDALNALCTVSFIVGALFAIAAVFAGLCSFKRGYREAFVRTVKGMLRSWLTYLIILGSLAMLILFCYYPGISSMVLSFFDYTQANPTMRFNYFENYIEIFTNEANLIAFRNMLVFLVSDIITALLPPVIFAMCLVFMRNQRYSTFARVVLFLPTVLPGIANLLIWKQGIYGIDGVVNLIIKICSGQGDAYQPILFFQDYGIPSLIMMGFPFVGSYLIFFGALMNVPSSYYEAAELDGCPLMKRIGMIDLPMISSQIKYVFVLSFIQSVQNFGRVLMTTNGEFGTQIPIVSMYKQLQLGNYGVSSAYATLMFLVLIVVTIFNMRIQTADWEV